VDHRSPLLACGAMCLCAVLIAALGCSKGRAVGEVRGTVTLDGKPLEEGTVQLSALDGQAPTAGAQIVNGKFETRAAITKYRVKIECNIAVGPDGKKIETGKKMDKYSPRPEFTIKQLVPDKYNANSELELDVKSGLNESRFDLTTK
jgi:hypothetical protein